MDVRSGCDSARSASPFGKGTRLPPPREVIVIGKGAAGFLTGQEWRVRVDSSSSIVFARMTRACCRRCSVEGTACVLGR